MRFHHVCIIASDYEKTVDFYVKKLGMTIHNTSFSQNRNAQKLELYCNGQYMIELFIMKDCRDKDLSFTGVDHISFLTDHVEKKLKDLGKEGVPVTEVKTDKDTGKKYGFCFDPYGTKIELYNE